MTKVTLEITLEFDGSEDDVDIITESVHNTLDIHLYDQVARVGDSDMADSVRHIYVESQT